MLSFRRWVANTLSASLPPTRMQALKRQIWRFAGVEVGKDVNIVSSMKIWTSGPVRIGARTFIGHEVLIAGGDAPISIGEECDLAPRAMLLSGTHEEGEHTRAAGAGVSRPIIIGDGVWIGAGSIILAGTKIGHSTIVGAGSLVSRSLPDGVVAVGAPCKAIRARRKAATPTEPHK